MLYDDILTQHLGEFGTYQITMFILVCLVQFPTAWQNMAITLYGADMNHWCKVPELENFTHSQQQYISIPYDDENSQTYEQCNFYNLNYSSYSVEELLSWNRSEVPADTEKISCNVGWVYDQTTFHSTLVSQFDLVCDNSGQVALVQTIYMCGFLVGCLVFGQLADKIGRLKSLAIANFMQVVCPLACAFMPVFAGYIAMRFFCGAASGAGIAILFVMISEIVGPKYRVRSMILAKCFYAAAYMLLPCMSYAIRDHIKLQIVVAVCPACLWLSYIVLTETPRWLIQEGRDEEALSLMRKIAVINKTSLPDKMDLSDNRTSNEIEELGRNPNLTDLFRTPALRGVTLNSWFNWLATSMVYYGLSLGVDMLPGSIFVNTFIAGAIEVPAALILAFTIDIWGRKWTNFGTLMGAGISCLLCMIFIDDPDQDVAAITLLMLGKFFSAGTFDLIYLYATELFPTLVRSVGLGSSSMSGRVGSLLQPQVARLENLWVPAPFLVYGAISILSGGLALLFPETLGRKLPDTLAEGEEFAKHITFRVRPKAVVVKVDEEDNLSGGKFVIGIGDVMDYGAMGERSIQDGDVDAKDVKVALAQESKLELIENDTKL